MTAIDTSSLVASTVAPQAASLASPVAPASKNNDITSSDTGFGTAVNVTLSVPAQAIANSSSTTTTPAATTASTSVSSGVASSSASSTSGAAPASGSGSSAPAGGGGGAPVSTGAADTTAELITTSERKAALEVGIADAASVVDKNGNIDNVEVAKIVAQQAAEKAEF